MPATHTSTRQETHKFKSTATYTHTHTHSLTRYLNISVYDEIILHILFIHFTLSVCVLCREGTEYPHYLKSALFFVCRNAATKNATEEMCRCFPFGWEGSVDKVISVLKKLAKQFIFFSFFTLIESSTIFRIDFGLANGQTVVKST